MIQASASADFSIDILVQGFPGKTVCHRRARLEHGRAGARAGPGGADRLRQLRHAPLSSPSALRARALAADVTDVILTHAHYDHSINWPMFSSSRC
jgi:hypothetical protein